MNTCINGCDGVTTGCSDCNTKKWPRDEASPEKGDTPKLRLTYNQLRFCKFVEALEYAGATVSVNLMVNLLEEV